MNKYQDALDELTNFEMHGSPIAELTNDADEILQELVDRATPMKPIRKSFFQICPVCETEVYVDEERYYISKLPYCPKCGQALDWT